MTIAKPSFSLIGLAIPVSNIATMLCRSEARTLPLQAASREHAPASPGASSQ